MADPILQGMQAEHAYGSIYSSQYADAAKSAKANETARRLGLDPDIVEHALPDMMAEDRLRRRSAEISTNGPYARAMANERLARAAIDDDHLPNVARQTDQLAQMHGPKTKWFGDRYVGMLATTALGGLFSGVQGVAQYAQGIGESATQTRRKSMFGSWLPDPIEILGPIGRSLAVTPGWLADHLNPQTGDHYQDVVLSGARSTGGSMAALGASLLTGSPLAGAIGMGASTGGLSYATGRSKGLDPNTALSYGTADAIVETATELLPEKFLFGAVKGGKGVIRTLLGDMIREVPGELAATILQNFNQWAYIDRNKGVPFTDYVKQLPADLRDTALATITTVGAMGSGGYVTGRYVDNKLDQRRAAQVNHIMEAAAQSPTRTANPSDFREALNQLVDGTGAENLYIPAQAIVDSLPADQPIAEHPVWGAYAPQIEEAVQLGGDVVVPVADAATSLAGTPLWEAIKDQVRTRPSGVSITEAKERQSPEELERMAEASARGIASNIGQVQLTQARQAVGNWSQQLGYQGERANVINRMLASAMATRYNAENAKRVAAGEQPVAMTDFAASWLPQATRMAQADYDRAAEGRSTVYAANDDGAANDPQAAEEQPTGPFPGGRLDGGRLFGTAQLLDEPAGSILGTDQPIAGAPTRLTVPGRGQVEIRPHRPAREAAASYMRRAGRWYAPATRYAKVDEARAKRIADAFEEMEHAPNDPLVRAAYDAMIDETLAQFQAIKQTGIQIEFIDGEDPYAASPRLAILDVIENNHLWVFPTEGGFGQGEVTNSPMLRETDEFVDGRRLLVNDVFRIVHDYFGHVKDGHGFRAEGEENAWQSHAAMYSPLARRAMTTETRGQNSWLNFGPYAEFNKTASAADTRYAPQKVGLMPAWASEEGYLGGIQLGDVNEALDQLANSVVPNELDRPPVDENGDITLQHYSPLADLTMTDPAMWGSRGTHFFSRSEREYMNTAPPRTYFGIATGRPGGYRLEFRGRHPYEAKVSADRVYDVRADSDNLWVKGNPAAGEQAIKDAGYAGYWHKNRDLGLVAVMFEPLDVTPSPNAYTLDQAVEVPGFKNIAPYLTAEERENLREASKKKILDIVKTLPDAEEAAAVAVAGRAKKGWYARSAQAIVDVFGLGDAPRFAALLAALSPQTSVEMNFYNALRTWTMWNNAGRPTDRATIVSVMGEAAAGKKGSGSLLNAWINNSVTALTSNDPGKITLSGPKVNSFMNNLVGVVDEVTNDTWMANYADVDPVTFRSVNGQKGLGYKAFNTVIRKAAEIATEKTGVDWTPSEIQEAVWSFARTLYLRRDTAGEDRSMQDLLDAGQITHADIAATPDFAVLFADGIFRTILEEGGYDTSTIESIGRDARLDGETGSVAVAEGTGFERDAFRQFLGQAASRLEAVRQRRRADRQANETQQELVFNQAVNPAEAIFYSAAERAVASSKQEKATAEQWKALLTPGKTPGIKTEEIEWTGIHDWLDMQKGPIEKGALLQVLRDQGIHVDEVVLGEPLHEGLPDGYEIINRGTGFELINPDGNPQGDLYHTERAAITAARANEMGMSGMEPQFSNWSSDPSNSTYRELLITLPLGHGSNPDRAPGTHWDAEAVVAHARFMDKTDADGKRVLFIEEVQSDWHQKGRDQGYAQQASTEELDAARKAHDGAVLAKHAVAREFAEATLARMQGLIANLKQSYTDAELADNQRHADRIKMWLDQGEPSQAATVAELAYQTRHREDFLGERDQVGTDAYARAEETWETYKRASLRVIETSQALGNLSEGTGIPNAPFKSTWPALVMKRMIVWGVRNGYDRVAWTTGDEQESRYWGEPSAEQRNFTEVTKPPRVREELFEVLGSELASVLPLEIVDPAMLPALKNDKVREAVIKAIPVDVVNVLARHKLTPEQLASDPNMVGDALPVMDRAPVARGFADALQLVGTRLRAALDRVPSFEAAGGDGKLFSAIRASDLDPSVIVRLLTTPAKERANRNPAAGEAGAGAGTEAGRLARIGAEDRSAALAVALNWHGRLVSNTAGHANPTKYEGPPGEGMRAFYDRNLVNITNDIIKKYGAKVGPVGLSLRDSQKHMTDQQRRDLAAAQEVLADPAVTGVRRRYAEGTVRELAKFGELEKTKAVHPGFEITDKMREAATGGFSLFQKKRGNISIAPGDDGMMKSALIRAFEASDFSTAVHELGHFFLEDLRRRALTSSATNQERADWETFKNWATDLGHETTDSSPIPVEAHEYFARGFERYTWEGQAPSIGLRHLFFRLREFMLELYRTATRFNSPITPEIRNVMGRMIASDQELEDQRQRMNLAAGKVDELMTEQERKAYTDLHEETRQDARDTMFARVLSTLKQEKLREARDEKAQIRAEVQAEVDQQPLFRALKLLRVGQPLPDGSFARVKLSRQQLIEAYGPDIESKLPRTVPPIIADEGEMDVDQIAALVGFDSGDEMMKALTQHGSAQNEMRDSGDRRSVRQRMVDDMVDRRYRDEVGDPLDDLEEEAEAALSSDRQADLLSMELRAMTRKSGGKPTAWRLAKEWAQKRVRIQTTQEALSGRAIQMYARNVSKAAQQAEEALIAGDFDEAFAAKQRQLLNTALLSEAHKVKDEVEKAATRMRKLAKRDTIPSVDQGYLDQAHQLLEDVDLKTKSQSEVARRQAFEDWYLERVAEGIEPTVPVRYRDQLGKTHWTHLAIDELLELDRAVGQIVELGRLKKKLRDGQQARDFDEGVMEMVGQGEGQPPRRKGKTTDPERTFGGRVASRLRGIDAAMIKMEQLVEWLDGDAKNGPWRRMLFSVIADAQTREKDLTESYVTRLNAMIQAMPKEQVRQLDRRVDTPELIIRNSGHSQAGEPFRGTKDQIIMMAMNWGNEGNRQRLLDGFGWQEADVLQVFDRLMTKEDWDFVQGVWDLVDELWPEIEQLERRVNGVAPEKVEATEVQTGHGVYRGGYFPVVYDPNESTRAELDEASKLSPNGAWHQVTTRSGSTKSRVDQVRNRPVQLNMGVITRHIGEVIHDVTHREAVVQARKIISDNRVRAVVNSRLGPEYYRRMGSWLENVATPNMANSKSDPAAIAVARHLNKGISLTGLGFRISTVLVQPLGLANSISEIGTLRMSEGVKIFTSNPRKTYNEIVARSGEMRSRFSTMDASIDDMMTEARGGKLKTIGPKAFVKYAFHGILYVDMLVTSASWIGAFNKAMAEGEDEDSAVAYADGVIRKTQGAGGQKDRSAIMFENQFARSFWPFFSYLNALYNQQRDVVRRARKARSVGDALEVARRAWWVAVVPTLLQALIFGNGPDDDDAESWGWYLIKSIILGNMSSLPGIGPLATALGSGFGYRSNAWQGIGEDIKKSWEDIDKLAEGEDEDLKGSTIQKVLSTAGILLAKPLGQPAATGRGLYDYATGEADPQSAGDWYNLLTKGRIPEQPTAIQRIAGSEQERAQ